MAMESSSSTAAEPVQLAPFFWSSLRRPGNDTFPYRRRDEILTAVGFVAGVLLFCGAALGIELAAGDPLAPRVFPPGGASGLDAVWHLATAFLLALPARRRAAAVVGPVLALGLDADHVFGGILPTVVGREAHDVFFLVLVSAGLYLTLGRPAGLLAAGAVVAHIAVDGGVFPFVAPVSTQTWPLPFAGQVVLLAAAGLLFFLAVRPSRQLRELRVVAPLAAMVALVAAVTLVLWPVVLTFSTQV